MGSAAGWPWLQPLSLNFLIRSAEFSLGERGLRGQPCRGGRLLPLPIGLALHLEMTAGREVPPSLPLPWPQQVDTLSPGGAGWWQPLPLSGPIPVPLQPGARVGPWAASVRRGRRGGCAGAQRPGSGSGAGWIWGVLSPLVPGLAQGQLDSDFREDGLSLWASDRCLPGFRPWPLGSAAGAAPLSGVGRGPQAQGGSVVSAPHLLAVQAAALLCERGH